MPVCDRVLIMATAAASGYHVAQLARTLYLGRFAGDGGCRRAMACVSFFLDKVPSHPSSIRGNAFALYYTRSSPTPKQSGLSLPPTVSV
jgi:hypothetical protein